MRNALKRTIAAMLAIPLLATALATPMPVERAQAEEPDSAAAYVGFDKTTLGAWNGKYGRDGYVLFGYGNTPPGEGEPTAEKAKYENDTVMKPSYVEEIDGRAYGLNDLAKVRVEPGYRNDQAAILDMPAGSGLPGKVEAAVTNGDYVDGIGDRRIFTFHLNDEEEHLFTMYSTKDMNWKYFAITDLDGNELVPRFRGGDKGFGTDSTYITFRVKGSFRFVFEGAWLEGVQGIFFDPATPEEPAGASSASYLGIDKTTDGRWNGKYGKDGYILIGYGATPPSSGDIAIVPKYEHDIVKQPEYVQSIDGRAYRLNDAATIRVKPGTRNGNPHILDIPAGSGLTDKIEAFVGEGDANPGNGDRRRLFTFHLNDDQEHIFTVYSTNDMNWKYYGIQDLGGQYLVPRFRGIDKAFGDTSTYISFRVKGSFVFELDGDALEGVQGMFFDTDASKDLQATAEPNGAVQLQWSNVGAADAVLIERSADGANYLQIASVAGSSTSYRDTDEGLLAGTTYHYRTRYLTAGTHSSYSAPVAVQTQAAAEEAEPRAFLGVDRTTRGHWAGAYGGDGYILAGYAATPVANQWTTATFGEDDIASLPAYLTSYSASPSTVSVGPSTDNDNGYDYVLDMPADAGRPKFKATVTGGSPKTFTFLLNDTEEHVFSMFVMEKFWDADLQLQDLDGRVLDRRTILKDTFDGYVSFLVKGSFRLVVNSSDRFGPSGFFFDAPLADRAANVTAALLPPRRAEIAWTDAAGAAERIVVERGTNNVGFRQIAELASGTERYVDSNLVPGQTYYYRIRYANGTAYGSGSASVSVTVPPMAETVVELLSGNLAANLGEEATVTARFRKAPEGGSVPLANKTVQFKLRGEHVGDGTTLGQEIPELIGTAVTDENGVATLTFLTRFAGVYGLVASVDPDNVDSLNGAVSAPIQLAVDEPEWMRAPAILKLSDAVAAGKLFTVNGYGLTAGKVEIAIERDTPGAEPAEPPAAAVRPAIVQQDRSGFFVVAQMPEDAEPGVYNVWVKNDYGWSEAQKMNAARPLFISEYEAFAGLEIQIAGRNFDAEEFGGSTDVKVRLNDGAGRTDETTVRSVNPYGITFAIEDQPLGEYSIEVSNDGGLNWSRLENGQTLTVNAPGEDPLGLGVAWAADFNWEHRVDVTDYGADPTDAEDDTAAVQQAVDAAAVGGGVAYFPAGSYYLSTVNLPADVVLQGEDREATKLIYTGDGGNFINTKNADPTYTLIPEKQGVARMTLLLSDPEKRPDSFIWLGEAWGASVGDMTMRTANRLFVAEVDITYPTDTKGSTGRGLGLEFVGKERILVQNNRFVGWHATPYITYMSQYYQLRNNYFEFTEGYLVGTATYSFYEYNTVKAVHSELHKESHGLFARSNAYIANNYVENMGDTANVYNDGEAICTEMPAGIFNYGKVLRADSLALTVAPTRTLVNPDLQYGALSVLITDGRGIGQLHEVESIDGYTITLKEPFDIVPDSTSRFSLQAPTDKTTVYNNTVRDNAKGIWLFGNAYDSVVADNTVLDSEGIFLWTARVGDGLASAYFSRIAGNTVDGISRRSFHGGIGFNTARVDNGHYYEVDAYSTEIRGNSVTGDRTATPRHGITEAPPYGGIYAISATFSSQYDGQGSGDATNTVIEDNVLSDLKTGVDLTHSLYGQVVKGNRYDATVLKFIEDTGSENTILSDNLQVGEQEIPLPPTAAAVAISGTARVGATLEGSYAFADPDGDAERASKYQWYRSDAADGTYRAIPGATELRYTVTSADIGRYLMFGVIPKAAAAPQLGAEALSAPTGRVLPALEPTAYYTISQGSIHQKNPKSAAAVIAPAEGVTGEAFVFVRLYDKAKGPKRPGALLETVAVPVELSAPETITVEFAAKAPGNGYSVEISVWSGMTADGKPAGEAWSVPVLAE
jgi:parallel beta-helix repeat protein